MNDLKNYYGIINSEVCFTVLLFVQTSKRLRPQNMFLKNQRDSLDSYHVGSGPLEYSCYFC